jgi:hypothetical protein
MFEGVKKREINWRVFAAVASSVGVAAVAGCGGGQKTVETVTATTPGPGATGPHEYVETEQSESGADTFANYRDASRKGPHLDVGARVVVDCLQIGPVAAAPSVHGKWYHLIGPEADRGYYVAANTFENGNPNDMTLAVDPNVPECPTP